MTPYQKSFIDLCVKRGVLKFGDFTLKSGRPSPYFFNAGELNDGEALNELALSYGKTVESQFHGKYDMLFGPAYKGIPLVTISCLSLYQATGTNVPYAYNRKEAKDHGEGGVLVGASMQGKQVIVIDDVMTAGTAVRESVDIITKAGGTLAGVVIAMNRQERSTNDPTLSAVQSIEQQYGVQVASIISADLLVEYLVETNAAPGQIQKIRDHLETYGVKDLKSAPVASLS